jgi:hypothetical protein
MKKTAFIALASVMLVILCSFRVQPAQALKTQPETIATTMQEPFVEFEEPVGIDCMKAGMAAVEAIWKFVLTDDGDLKWLYFNLWLFWTAVWADCH